MAGALFVGPARLGWEYHEEPPAPYGYPAPPWHEPPPPETGHWVRQRAEGWRRVPPRLTVSLVVVWLAGLVGGVVLVVTVTATFAWAVGLPVLLPSHRIRRAETRHHALRQSLATQYHASHAQWQHLATLHGRREQERLGAADAWFPLSPPPACDRIDVFGGTADGWAGLVVTLGSSLLSEGRPLTMLDLTSWGVARELTEYALAHGLPCHTVGLAGTAAPDLFSGLDAAGVAELVAEALHPPRRPGDAVDRRALCAELVGTAASALGPPLTVGRVVAGLRALRGLHVGDDVGSGTAELSEDELHRVTRGIDVVGAGEPVRSELQALTGLLGLLAPPAGPPSDAARDAPAAPHGGVHGEPLTGPHSAPAGPEAPTRGGPAGGPQVTPPGDPQGGPRRGPEGGPAPPDGFAGVLERPGLCLVTAVAHGRRKEVLDALASHRLLAELRRREHPAGYPALVLAGADRLAPEAVEDLTRHARRLGMYLVVLYERLRGELAQLVGGPATATVYMRLGNHEEAEVAARHIGRGHRFVVSQLTRQVSETLTTGGAVSTGVQQSTSATSGHSGGSSGTYAAGLSGNAQRGWSEAVSLSRSESWQSTASESIGRTTGDSAVLARTYEFEVEPVQLQSLPQTAFVLVDPTGPHRRVVMGDCNPGVVLLPKVSSRPRGSDPISARGAEDRGTGVPGTGDTGTGDAVLGGTGVAEGSGGEGSGTDGTNVEGAGTDRTNAGGAGVGGAGVAGWARPDGPVAGRYPAPPGA